MTNTLFTVIPSLSELILELDKYTEGMQKADLGWRFEFEVRRHKLYRLQDAVGGFYALVSGWSRARNVASDDAVLRFTLATCDLARDCRIPGSHLDVIETGGYETQQTTRRLHYKHNADLRISIRSSLACPAIEFHLRQANVVPRAIGPKDLSPLL